MDDQELTAPRRWPLILAAVATLVWIAMVGALIIEGVQPNAIQRLLGVDMQVLDAIANLSFGVTAPLAILWLIALRLRDRSGARAEAAAHLALSLDTTDARLASAHAALQALHGSIDQLGERVAATGTTLADQARALGTAHESWSATSTALGSASDAASAAAAALTAAAPMALGQAGDLAALLTQAEADMRRQQGESAAMIATLHDALRAASDAALQRAAQSVEAIEALAAASGRATSALQGPAEQLTIAVDAAFTRTAAAMDASRDGVHAQTSALLTSVDQARITLDQIGGEAAREIHKRLETLLRAAEDLGAQLETQQIRSRDMVDQVERGFGVLDAKLSNSVASGNVALDTFTAKTTAARDSVHRLVEPVGEVHSALVAVEARVVALSGSTTQAIDALASALPAAIPHISAIAAQLDGLYDRAEALAAPIEDGQSVIAASQAQMDATRAAMETAAARLTTELGTAREHLDAIEQQAGSTALSASAQLIDVFARVREIAAQTSGTMRETLSGVVDEAEAALDKAGTAKAESAFGAPVRARIAELEDVSGRAAKAAQAASERLTRQLVDLTKTVATVEARIDEVDAHYDVRLRDDIAHRSAALLESLKGTAVDIAGLLAIEVSDTDWDRYLKGDKGLFARRTVKLIDGGTARVIARHFKHDPEFRVQATRYIEEFETLIGRAQGSRDGKSLAVTLLSSDIGKLYVALAQGTERIR